MCERACCAAAWPWDPVRQKVPLPSTMPRPVLCNDGTKWSFKRSRDAF